MNTPKNTSAGLLMHRKQNGVLQFFLVHPGGPYFKEKDDGWWTIPKGMPEREEELFQTACREFEEETGIKPQPPFLPLGEVKQKGGKWVHAWAFEGDWNEKDGISCNTFKVEWPYKSGRWQEYPEADRAGWFTYEEACIKINAAQRPFLDILQGSNPA